MTRGASGSAADGGAGTSTIGDYSERDRQARITGLGGVAVGRRSARPPKRGPECAVRHAPAPDLSARRACVRELAALPCAARSIKVGIGC
jgi:hypothetical protein